MNSAPLSDNVVIVGGGFTGLAAAYELVKQGRRATVLEAENEIGGLAAAFTVGGTQLDRFYHHWFTNDLDFMALINELGLHDHVEINPTNTGIYYANHFFKLSTPMDLLRFTPLSFADRLRLGILALRARRVRDWRQLEGKTASDWLREMGGKNVYRIIWEPLLLGKFGPYAKDISAVWFWNKLKLRGGSRGKGGEERLAYFRGGFIALVNALAEKIKSLGGQIICNARATAIVRDGATWRVETEKGAFSSGYVIATTALPLVADLISAWAPPSYVSELQRIRYIGNVCLVLELDRPLSQTYWLNVNDPSFPFVGVIEHTNFEKAETYGGRHIVYLSKYLPHTDALYSMGADEFLDFTIPYLRKMFPDFRRESVRAHYLWRARWSQPVVERYYSKLIPAEDTPFKGLHLCSMAQIYPEDRGTNYAIRAGRNIGKRLAETIAPNREGAQEFKKVSAK